MTQVLRHRSDLSDLHVFYAVAVCGSLTAAAKTLRIDPSTVTRTLDQLEARLNARLVRRGPQGTSLTQAGEMALSRVRTIEHLISDMEDAIIDAEAALPEGRVGIDVPDGIGAYFLAPELPRLLRENPNLHVGLDCGLSPDHPLRTDPELTLTFGEPATPDAVSKVIAYLHYALFASKSYLDLYGVPTSLDEVLRHPYIHHTAQTNSEKMSRRVPAFQDLANRRLETNSSAAAVEAVMAGLGIAALPTAILPRTSNLVMVGIPTPPIALRLEHHRDAVRIPRVRAVVEWLEDVFDARTRPWFREEYVDPAHFAQNAGAGGAKLKQQPATTPTPLRRNRR